ncbi:hypothetical protein DXG03_004437, partial [Asterophora parasitica]
RAGALIKAWKSAVAKDDSADVVTTAPAKAGTKRKAETSLGESEIRDMYLAGTMGKLRVDQLKEFCREKALPVSGKKADLIDRIADYLDTN